MGLIQHSKSARQSEPGADGVTDICICIFPFHGKTAQCPDPKWGVLAESHFESSVHSGGPVPARTWEGKGSFAMGATKQWMDRTVKSSDCFEEQPLSAQSPGEIRGDPL